MAGTGVTCRGMRSPLPPDEFAPFDPQPPVRPAAFAPPKQLADPHGMPTKHMHVKWNPWELEQLERLARRDCVPMTTLVRRIVRQRLLSDAKL